MAGMLGKFIAGAAQTGADIIKSDRLNAQEQEGRKAQTELQARLQGELQARQNEFLTGQQERNQTFLAGQTDRTIAAGDARASADRASVEQRTQADRAAQAEVNRARSEQDERQHRERMGALNAQLQLAREKRGKGDNPLEVIKIYRDLARDFQDAGETDLAAKLRDDIKRMLKGDVAGAAPPAGPPKEMAGPGRTARASPARAAAAPAGMDRLTRIQLENLVKSEPNSARGRDAAAKLAEEKAGQDADFDESGGGSGFGYGNGNNTNG